MRRTGWRYAVLTVLALGLLAVVAVRVVGRSHPTTGHGHPPRAVALRLSERDVDGPLAIFTDAPAAGPSPVPAAVAAGTPHAPGGPAVPRRGGRAPPD